MDKDIFIGKNPNCFLTEKRKKQTNLLSQVKRTSFVP